MLTPLDKLHSGVNDTIQIVVTTSCDLFTCSNCTQLLPFRKDYRHMSVRCFIKALESVQDWLGVVGLFGGNPCTHPRFKTLCLIMTHMIPEQRRRGLWSNNLMGHGSVVRDTFYPDGRFNLNVHGNPDAAKEMDEWVPGRVIPSSVRSPAWHSPILLNHADFDMPHEEWVSLREHCDINQKWSAAIVERDGEPYVYFCEVAAALDGIRGENHGLPATPGWWEAPIETYRHQIVGCCDHGCGVPLRARGHLDNADTYDISKSFVPLLHRGRGILNLRQHRTRPAEIVEETTDYMRLRTEKEL